MKQASSTISRSIPPPGAGRALVAAAVDWFRQRQMPRVMLWTSTQNTAARELFLAAGFRPTMTEMTMELKAEG